MDIKQIIVIRKDLNMRKGKMVAQGAHASMGAVLSVAQDKNSDRGNLFIPLKNEAGELTSLGLWLNGKFKKITVSVDTEKELLELTEQVKKLGIMHCLIQDSGLTEFGGVPTYTALAIGPNTSEILDPITGHLKLL